MVKNSKVQKPCLWYHRLSSTYMVCYGMRICLQRNIFLFLNVYQNFTSLVQSSRPEDCNVIKKTLAQVFSCEFSEISNNTFFKEHLWWLPLTWSRSIQESNLNHGLIGSYNKIIKEQILALKYLKLHLQTKDIVLIDKKISKS